jgi:HTH-type transcriptional regulator / antitoxin HipB
MIAKTPKDLGLLLREQRRQLGLDQQELAKRAGTSRQWIIAVEKGKARAEVGLVLRAMAVLGLTLDVRPSESRTSQTNALTMDLDAVIERARHLDAAAPVKREARLVASRKPPATPRPSKRSKPAKTPAGK